MPRIRSIALIFGAAKDSVLRMHNFTASASIESFCLPLVPLKIEKERGTSPEDGGSQAYMMALYVSSPFRFSENITQLMQI